jgi:hypothetical protein
VGAWRAWDRAHTYVRTSLPGIGEFSTWTDVVSAEGEYVAFRSTTTFGTDGATLTSDSTLRFRSREALSESLSAAGFTVDEIRDAPDRPGLEWVFVAARR